LLILILVGFQPVALTERNYSIITQIPQDVEKGYQRVLCNDIPLLEDTITLITVIHLTALERHNVDALECLFCIVRRAATLMVFYISEKMHK